MKYSYILTALLAVGSGVITSATTHGQTLKLVSRSTRGGGGRNGDLTIIGTAAVVAAGLMPAGGAHAHLLIRTHAGSYCQAC